MPEIFDFGSLDDTEEEYEENKPIRKSKEQELLNYTEGMKKEFKMNGRLSSLDTHQTAFLKLIEYKKTLIDALNDSISIYSGKTNPKSLRHIGACKEFLVFLENFKS